MKRNGASKRCIDKAMNDLARDIFVALGEAVKPVESKDWISVDLSCPGVYQEVFIKDSAGKESRGYLSFRSAEEGPGCFQTEDGPVFNVKYWKSIPKD